MKGSRYFMKDVHCPHPNSHDVWCLTGIALARKSDTGAHVHATVRVGRVKSPLSLFYLVEKYCPHTPPAQRSSRKKRKKKAGEENTGGCRYVTK